jgi:hypothetical protein
MPQLKLPDSNDFVILFPAIFLMFALCESRAREPKIVAGCVAGFLFGCAPILYFLIVDHQSFLKWTVQVFIHFLKFRSETMMEGAASLAQLTTASMLFFGQMVIPIAFAIARMAEEYRRSGFHEPAARLALVVSALVMAISPFYVNDQYLAPLALLLFQFSMPSRSSSATLHSRYVVFSVVFFCTQAGLLINNGIRQYFVNGGFDVVEVIRLQKRAGEIVGAGYNCDRKFYSAEPLFLLDNKVQYPRELAAGPFLLFLGRRALTEIGDEFDITARIDRWNPDVVIWGYFLQSVTVAADEVDRIVRDYAVNQKFSIVPLGPFDGRDMFMAYRAACRP